MQKAFPHPQSVKSPPAFFCLSLLISESLNHSFDSFAIFDSYNDTLQDSRSVSSSKFKTCQGI
jgi:hypothetical protein